MVPRDCCFYVYCVNVHFHRKKKSNYMINKIRERALRLILTEHLSDFDTLLQNNKDACLVVEVYKIKIA